MYKEKERLLGRQVWCQDCMERRPPNMKGAEFLIPLRERPYDLYPDDSGIDRRVCGICSECLICKGKFQQSNAQPISIKYDHFIYKAG